MSRLAVRPARPGAESSDHELEADVMRFVAIIALCIVAISTLVEERAPSHAPPEPAIPVEPASPMVPAPPASPPAPDSARAGGVEPITPQPLAPPRPIATVAEPPEIETGQPGSPPTAGAPQRPQRSSARAERPAAVETPREAPARPPAPGFVLRFASDAALLRLVARGEAAVYVFDGDDILRLEYGPAGASFTPAPGPARYHAVAAPTVPSLLREALAGERPGRRDVVWGVTLPELTRRRLVELMGAHRSGELVIDGRGRVTLETADG